MTLWQSVRTETLRSDGPHADAGFTLLEILVALAILSIALVVIFQLFSAGLSGVAASEDYVTGVIKAESRMRAVLDDEKLAEKSWSETTNDGYRIDTVVAGTEDKRTENLQVKLLEITLTVRWTKGVRERAVTLKTMKVVPKQI